MQRRLRFHGFTLAELMIVLVVLGILIGAAAVPFGRTLDRYAARAARDALAAGIAHARASAVANGSADLVITCAPRATAFASAVRRPPRPWTCARSTASR